MIRNNQLRKINKMTLTYTRKELKYEDMNRELYEKRT